MSDSPVSGSIKFLVVFVVVWFSVFFVYGLCIFYVLPFPGCYQTLIGLSSSQGLSSVDAGASFGGLSSFEANPSSRDRQFLETLGFGHRHPTHPMGPPDLHPHALRDPQ